MKDLVKEIAKNYDTRLDYEVKLKMRTSKSALRCQIIANRTSVLYHLDISLSDM